MVSIAVLMASYNGGRFIGEQLASLMAQSCSDFTVYIHDDGSSDNTIEIIQQFMLDNPGRIELVDGPPCGCARDNFWFLLSVVEADIYFFCDQDDVWLEDKIKYQTGRLLELSDTSCRCVFSDMKVVDEELNVIDESFLHFNGRDPGVLRCSRIIIDNPAAGTSMCFDRALRDRATAWDFNLDGIEMHDGFLLAIASLCGTVAYIDRPLVLYRQHSSNEMGAARAETLFERILRNLSDLISGRMIENKRAFLKLSRNTARELTKMTDIPQRERRILYKYSVISKIPKPFRILFLWKNGFDRARHTWWMWLWM